MTTSDIINLSLGLLGIILGFIMFWSLPVVKLSNRDHEHDDENIPLVTIIVPARNEEARISSLLRSLQEQSFRSYELLVVDDHSSDHTAAMAKAYGATVLSNKSEGTGAGKSMACWLGARHAKGKWLLFLDADTWFTHTDALRDLLLFYRKKGSGGILSLQPFHAVVRLYENLSSLFNIIVIAGMNLFSLWGNQFKTAGSFGPCLLCNKDDYFRSGGHLEIQGAIMDDLALGQAFLNKKLPVHCLGGKGIISFRMYPEGFGSLVDGWCKSFAIGSKSTHPAIMLMIILWISGSFISTGVLTSSIVATAPSAMTLSSILYLLYIVQTAWFARRCGNFRRVIFIAHPLLFSFFTGLFVYSLFRVNILHSVKWRGRKIDVKKR